MALLIRSAYIVVLAGTLFCVKNYERKARERELP